MEPTLPGNSAATLPAWVPSAYKSFNRIRILSWTGLKLENASSWSVAAELSPSCGRFLPPIPVRVRSASVPESS